MQNRIGPIHFQHLDRGQCKTELVLYFQQFNQIFMINFVLKKFTFFWGGGGYVINLLYTCENVAKLGWRLTLKQFLIEEGVLLLASQAAWQILCDMACMSQLGMGRP